MPDSQRRQQQALWVALALIVIWGANFSIQKWVMREITPTGFLFGRYALMPVCALLLLIWRHGFQFPSLSRDDLWGLARLGVIGHTMHVGMVTYGVHWSTAFSSSVILACGPLFTLIILRLHDLERLGRYQILGMAVACCGVLIFLSEKLLGGSWQATGGDLVLLVAASLFSYYTVAAKPYIERLGGFTTMAYATLFGSIPVLLLTAPQMADVPWSAFTVPLALAFVWAVVVSAFLGWLAWGWVNAVRGVARTAPLMYLMPPVAGLLAWAFMGESYTWLKVIGALVSLAGVAIAQFVRQPPWPRPPA
ncbi:MAG: DMT family transporter [Betaproteobacteria bacterium]|jgi:drug/metabolite transporter (DMT)-like permease|nr:DMT family transporter [Betaproteobacteria bacterium]NBU43300.1 DMT family transporter [Betaproteobacteria bacterium]NDF63563.1 DMT family transporter [Betaproteobacteria bacterium]